MMFLCVLGKDVEIYMSRYIYTYIYIQVGFSIMLTFINDTYWKKSACGRNTKKMETMVLIMSDDTHQKKAACGRYTDTQHPSEVG